MGIHAPEAGTRDAAHIKVIFFTVTRYFEP
jgi:hypothetical protein